MPKRRQYCDWETAAMNGTWSVTRNAPFGTNYTPDTARLKIINGKMVSVNDSDEQNLVNSRSHSETPPVTQSISSISRFPPVEPQRLLSTAELQQSMNHDVVTSQPRFGETKNREALAEFMPEDEDQNFSSVNQRRIVNQHHFLPPINPHNGRSHNLADLLTPANNGTTEALNNQSAFGQITAFSNHSSPMTKPKELENLTKRIRDELTNLLPNQLKYIYLKLTEADANLTGYISFSEVERIFHQSKVELSPATLRLIASMFLSVYHSNLVNYEGLVSFIAKAVQAYPDSDDRELTSTGALRRIVEKQLLAGGCCLDYEKIWTFFQRADRSRRDRLSRDQIKRLVGACHLPLSEFVVDQVLNRCTSTSDRYSWQDFLGYIEHVYPMKTSLTIPPTHRRVKEIPTVSSDWPDEETTPRVRMNELPEELFTLGTVVQETRRRLNDERRDGSYLFKPYFERFMRMVKAVYSFDQSNSGYMNSSVTRWIIQEYNKTFNLGLDETRIDFAMKPYTEGDKVAIEPFLKTLIAQAS